MACTYPSTCTIWGSSIHKVGQNRIHTPYMTVSSVVSLPNTLYIHRIYMVLVNPTHTSANQITDTYQESCINTLAVIHSNNRHVPGILHTHSCCYPLGCLQLVAASAQRHGPVCTCLWCVCVFVRVCVCMCVCVS